MANSSEKQRPAVGNAGVHDTGAAVQLAHDVQNHSVSPWTRGMFRLYLVLACAYLCGCLVCQSVNCGVIEISFTDPWLVCRTATMDPSWAVSMA